jgi:hypothetical protein
MPRKFLQRRYTVNHPEHNQYVKLRDGQWVVLNKEGHVISHHDSREKAEASFRAMEMNKHGD